MINTLKSQDRSLGAPELTPLIDIVFIVVVFLLITANTPLLSLPVDVPGAEKDHALSTDPQTELVITILAEQPYWHIDTTAFNSWEVFKQALLTKTAGKEQDNTLRITIAADKRATTEPLLKLLALLNQHHIANANLIMQPTSK